MADPSKYDGQPSPKKMAEIMPSKDLNSHRTNIVCPFKKIPGIFEGIVRSSGNPPSVELTVLAPNIIKLNL